jgi:hypothetical protein
MFRHPPRRQNLSSFVLVRAIVVCMLFLVSCAPVALDRRPVLEWSTSVQPSVICPDDTVTARWNTLFNEDCSTDGCALAPHTTVASFPETFRVERTSEREGEHEATITTDTRFFFTASPDYFENDTRQVHLPHHNHDVRVILPTVEVEIPHTFTGACIGADPSWGSHSVKSGELRSKNVRVTRVCNRNDFSIRVTLPSDRSTIDPISLAPGACTLSLPEELSREIDTISAIAEGPDPTLGAECTPTRTVPPRDIIIAIVFLCDPALPV